MRSRQELRPLGAQSPGITPFNFIFISITKETYLTTNSCHRLLKILEIRLDITCRKRGRHTYEVEVVQAVVPAPVEDEQALRRGDEGALHDVVDQADAGNTRPLALEGAIVGHHRVRGCAWQGRLVVVVTSSRQAHRSHAEECTLEIVGQD